MLYINEFLKLSIFIQVTCRMKKTATRLTTPKQLRNEIMNALCVAHDKTCLESILINKNIYHWFLVRTSNKVSNVWNIQYWRCICFKQVCLQTIDLSVLLIQSVSKLAKKTQYISYKTSQSLVSCALDNTSNCDKHVSREACDDDKHGLIKNSTDWFLNYLRDKTIKRILFLVNTVDSI